VAIAIVLLWYLPGRYGQDILGIGPTIAEIPYLGGIVPARFSGGNNANPDPAEDTSMGEPEFRPPRGADDGTETSINDYAPPEEEEPSNLELDLGSGPTEVASSDPDELAPPPVDFDNLDTPDEPAEANPPGPRAPGGQPLGPTDRLTITPADLKTAVEAVVASTPEYAASLDLTGDQRRTVSADHYNDYAALAEALTFVDQSDPSISPDVKTASSLLAELAADDAKTGIMNYFAASQLGDPPSTPTGILIVGTVTEIGVMGSELYLTTVEFTPTGGAERTVDIISYVNPAEIPGGGYTTGAKLATLGTLVANPAENLRGYQGDEPVVIWAGYFVPLN